ncbi:uncharacterized protein DUF3667 [Ulvibacter sp. MAR_2010_11]|uniref:DUF3667 domain-containing protein n=1 Tax=Ulvibacter sp. MAR_2010_11 TaxID=1250229 RepID=UPI000C2C8557|nr:DUF3667 domain-containing protein [Ulvibacter sp. MAR_2010_11]PKA82235.1 uncharacterized protein DUF3667 [Ulvibacter sp. MAR_2010_11]
MDCKNCRTPLLESHFFCPNCGGKIIRKRINFRNLLTDFSAQFLNYDNKFLQTFIALFSRPNDVIGGYLQGVRKKYVNVIGYFAIALTLSGLQIFLLNKFFPEVLDLSSVTTKGTEEFSKKNLEFINEYQSLIMMLYVPLYAFLAKLVFWRNKKFNYAELLVVFTYILSQISIISSVITIGCAFFGVSIGSMALFLIPMQIIYSGYCLKHLYGLSMEGILLRTLLFFLILGIFFVITSVIAGVIMYNSGAFKEVIEAQRAAQNVSYTASSVINWTS